MGKITATAFITLDNVVEEPHLWSGAYQSEDTGALNSEVLMDADSMLLGRVTYEGFAAAWPSRSGDPFSDKFNSMPKYVVSNTLERGDWDPTTVISGEDPYGRIRVLRDEQNVLVWGSPTLRACSTRASSTSWCSCTRRSSAAAASASTATARRRSCACRARPCSAAACSPCAWCPTATSPPPAG
jgi:dihydrofolate reductase